MKIELEPTSQTHVLKPEGASDARAGVPVRLWQGKTDQGTPILAFIALVGVDKETPCPEIQDALKEVAGPRPEYTVFPARMIL